MPEFDRPPLSNYGTQEILLLKTGGASEDDILAALSRYYATSAEYARFSKAMNLPQQRERVTVDGLGTIGQMKNTLTNAVGTPIIKVNRTTLKGPPNSITQKQNAKGGIDRNYYGDDGKQFKQVSNHDHGNPRNHPYGNHGEHAHDYSYGENDAVIRSKPRKLTDEERMENADIL